MKPESLTALLLDRELGELAPETSELLDAYLELSPDTTAVASIADTVALARRSVATPLEEPLQGDFANRLRQEQSKQEWRRRGRMIAQLAAGLVLGIGAGGWWFGSTAEPSALPLSSPLAHAERSLPANTAQRFWSRETFVLGAEARTTSRPRLTWTSPVRKPEVKE